MRRRRQFAATLHRYVYRAAVLLQPNVVDAEPARHIARGDDEGRSHAAGDPDPQAVADEIFAEALDGRIRNDAPLLDLRIDEVDDARLGGFSDELRAVDANPVARLEQARMPLRHAKPQLEVLLGDGDDRIAREHDGSYCDQPLQHATIRRREHLTLVELLVDHRTFGSLGTQAVLGDVQRGALLVELDPGQDTAFDQPFGPAEVELRLVRLRLQRLDLRVERFHLQHELFVADGRDCLAGGDAIPFLTLS